jgi:large subunit ribosomal protein L19
MSRSKVLEKLEKAQLKRDAEQFRVGDTVRVHIRIIEGEKERIQVFTGTVIARKGKGTSETFSVHRFAYGEGMERVFLLNSPRIAKIEVMKKGRVRRGKLYYLRGTSGKASKVKGQLAAYSREETAPVDNVNASESDSAQIENAAEAHDEKVKA